LCHQEQLHHPVPRGKGKEESRLIDRLGNPPFYVKISIVSGESRATEPKKKAADTTISPGALKSRIVR
jgi:hypothetical protein